MSAKKSFDDLLKDASIGRTECFLLVNFTRLFNDYAMWNLENELNSSVILDDIYNSELPIRGFANTCVNVMHATDINDLSVINLNYKRWIEDGNGIGMFDFQHNNEWCAADLTFIDLPIDDYTLMEQFNV